MDKAWTYLKKYRSGLLLSLFTVTWIMDVYPGIRFLRYSFVLVYLFTYYLDSQRGHTNIAERKAISNRGLSSEEIRNRRFVEKWGQIRTNGKLKYVIVFGGLYLGFGLGFLFSMAAILYVNNVFQYIGRSPFNMLSFIGYAYLAGFIAAAVLHQIVWGISEKKFTRLANAVH